MLYAHVELLIILMVSFMLHIYSFRTYAYIFMFKYTNERARTKNTFMNSYISSIYNIECSVYV